MLNVHEKLMKLLSCFLNTSIFTCNITLFKVMNFTFLLQLYPYAKERDSNKLMKLIKHQSNVDFLNFT